MAARILCFFIFFIGCAVNEGRLTGNIRCTWGPHYWCKDYGTAVECDALQHCRENVWKANRSNDVDPCTLCKLGIARVKNILDEASVQEQVLDFLKDVCDNAGLGPFTEKCKDIVTKYEPDIIKNLDKILADPENVCTKMGMCKAQGERVILASLIRHARPRIQVHPFGVDGLTDFQKCSMCKSIKKDLEKIPNRTKRIGVPLQQVCNKGSVFDKKRCEWTITKLLPVIISIMRMKVDQVCSSYDTRSCEMSARVVPHDLMTTKKLQDIGCDFCIYFMGEAEAILKNGSFTEKQFEKLILELCKEFKFMEYKCKQLVDEYSPLLYELLSELKPYQVCQELMMCPTAAAGQFRRDPRCFLGASFWCANLKNAKRCNALQYCMSHVWHAQIQ